MGLGCGQGAVQTIELISAVDPELTIQNRGQMSESDPVPTFALAVATFDVWQELRRQTQDAIGLLGSWVARVQAAHSEQPAAIRLALENAKRCSFTSRFPLSEFCKGPSHIIRAAKLDNIQPLAFAAFAGPFRMLRFDFFPSAGCRTIGRHHFCIR